MMLIKSGILLKNQVSCNLCLKVTSQFYADNLSQCFYLSRASKFEREGTLSAIFAIKTLCPIAVLCPSCILNVVNIYEL